MLTPKPKRTVSRDKRTGKLRGAAISGAEFEAILIDLDMTHHELGDLVGRSRSNITMFSNDFRKPPPELVALLNLLRTGTPRPTSQRRSRIARRYHAVARAGATFVKSTCPYPNSPQAGTSLYGPFMQPTIGRYSVPLAYHLCGQVSQSHCALS
jgi:hypothetical protein